MNAPTVRLETLGCKVNQYETQLVKETLLRGGYREAVGDEAADLCIVNTCTVTNEGDAKSRKLIRNLARKNPSTKTIVMGCYATRDPATVAELPGVAEVVTDKRELPDLFQRPGVLHTGPLDVPSGITEFDGRHRAYVKVQDGCILKCSYCIIPSVRPGLQSRSPDDIEDEVRRLIDNGHKEIVLAGIHVGHFGVDTTRGKSGKEPFRLWHLFRRLDRIRGDWRMRLSSVEAVEVNDDFAKAAADCEHLCPQFHPALQSGSNTVLKRMRRRYSSEKFIERCDRIRELVPDVAFTTDAIVGFPGETDEEFQQTIDVCRRVGFMKVHVFPFSARRSTPAAKHDNQVSDDVRKQRVAELSRVERELAVNFYKQHIGTDLEVLVERRPDELGIVRGTDRYYIPVAFHGTAADLGQFVNVRADSVTSQGVVGTGSEQPSRDRPHFVESL